MRKVVVFLYIITVALTSCRSERDVAIKDVRKFISSNWIGTLEENVEDTDQLIGLPKPYNVPSVHGEKMFKELYYWDTYFTNVGLILDGEIEQAKNNTDDIIYLVNRFGKMLNGSNWCYLNRSQPPYLSMMVADVYKATKDKEWLEGAMEALEKEYQFWMTQRITTCGLNRYSSSASDDEKIWMAELVRDRFNEPGMLDSLTRQQIVAVGGHYTAEAESGWDFNPRFEGRCEDFCPVDLNCNLYLYEMNFQYFYKELGLNERIAEWEKRAEKRKQLVSNLCFDEKSGLFYDYDNINGRRSPVLSAAVFSPLYTGMASKRQADGIRMALPRLETQYGLRTCEKTTDKRNYQWGAVNGWAALHYIAVCGLSNYGYNQEANRLRDKYLDLVTRNFKTTGNLWEKYNIEDGTSNALNEYEMPAFLGWTAGVFIYFDQTR